LPKLDPAPQKITVATASVHPSQTLARAGREPVVAVITLRISPGQWLGKPA
jgi:hypothetical protein